MKNSHLLLNIGNWLYKVSKYFIFFGPVGLGLLLITVLFCGQYALDYLLLSGYYPIVNYWVGFCYFLIVIGSIVVWPYFMGLILIGIGQIAKNTLPQVPAEAQSPSNKSYQVNAAGSHPNYIEQLKSYKYLLDHGKITQEEFDNMKKELLGL